MNFTGVLLVLFLVLKLAGLVTWSWWFVLAPLWVPLSIVIVLSTIVLMLGGKIEVGKGRK